MRPSSALLPRSRAAVGLASLLRRDIDFRRSIVGRLGDGSLLFAIATAGGGLGTSSWTFGTTLEESFRRRSDFLLANFEPPGDWVCASSSPAASDLEIDKDFFFTGDGEREAGLEKGWVHDLRFSFVARDVPLLSRGLAALEVVEVGVVDPLSVSSMLLLVGT